MLGNSNDRITGFLTTGIAASITILRRRMFDNWHPLQPLGTEGKVDDGVENYKLLVSPTIWSRI